MTTSIRYLAVGALMAGALSLGTQGQVLAADTYAIDGGHTEVRFEYLHLGISTQSGEFDKVSFEIGYTFKASTGVEVKIGQQEFGLHAEGSTAWTVNGEDDVRLVRAMRGSLSIREQIRGRSLLRVLLPRDATEGVAENQAGVVTNRF